EPLERAEPGGLRAGPGAARDPVPARPREAGELGRAGGRHRGARGGHGLRGDGRRTPPRRAGDTGRDSSPRAGLGGRLRRNRSLHAVAPSVWCALMGKALVIAEKPSVGRDVARVLPGPFAKHEGYLEGPEHYVSWAVGHLVQLAEPDEYDAKYKKWRMADLPIVPDRFKLVVRDERSKKQMNVIRRQLGREDIETVVNACDAGREGELIFAYLYEKAGSRKPVQRLWLNSMTKSAIKEAFSALRPGSELAPLEA